MLIYSHCVGTVLIFCTPSVTSGGVPKHTYFVGFIYLFHGSIVIFLFLLCLTLGKKNKKKGKTLTLTDFLAEDSGGSNIAPSYPNKSTSWADETDDLDGDGE